MPNNLAEYIVAIGISTGGPTTMIDILQKVSPPPKDTAYIVVQHMPLIFTKPLADKLSKSTPMQFIHTGEEEPICGGMGYLAQGNSHLEIRRDKRSKLFKNDAFFYYPSADVLFSSVAAIFPSRAVGVLLTGIGKDGAQGLLAMRQNGCVTIAESEETAVVYGMPKAAREINAAEYIRPSYEIAGEIERGLIKIRGKTF